MGNKNDFFMAMNRLAQVAKDAYVDMPDDMPARQKKIAQAFLTRIPDQVEDIKSFIDDSHTVTQPLKKHIIDPF